MKYRTWMKQYCKDCGRKLECEMNKGQAIDSLKYFATGAIYSLGKFRSLYYRHAWYGKTMERDNCPVMQRIFLTRLNFQKADELHKIKECYKRIEEYHKEIDTAKKNIRKNTGRRIIERKGKKVLATVRG